VFLRFLLELENSPLYDNTEIIRQEARALPHYISQVRDFLKNHFPQRIGRRITVTAQHPSTPM
jgi:hypothetical protein